MTSDDILAHLHRIAQNAPVVHNAILLAQARAEADYWRAKCEEADDDGEDTE